MNIYAELNRCAREQIATIKECEVLTDEIVKSANTFIGNAIKWDSGSYRPVADALHQRLRMATKLQPVKLMIKHRSC